MILLLAAVAWIAVLSLVAALCAVARLGDVELAANANAPVRGGETIPAWEPAENFEIAFHARRRQPRPLDSAPAGIRSDEVAA
jgi:hypothetical protein